jgi:aspartyl-tRNA(Asn)/glutamyl-tRNA(Gln) amidotransferase subunit A
MGVCAMTLPTGTASCGLMMMAAPGAEERLLRLAAAAQEALA